MNFVEKTVDLINELHELAVGNKLCISLSAHGQTVVHVLVPNTFFSSFKQYDLMSTEFDDLPYKACVEVENVMFQTLLTQEDYESYVLKTA